MRATLALFVVVTSAGCGSEEDERAGLGEGCAELECEASLICTADCSTGTCGPQTCEEPDGGEGEGEGEGDQPECTSDDDCGTQVCIDGSCVFDDLGDSCFTDLSCNYEICFTPEPTDADPSPDAYCSVACDFDMDCEFGWSCVDDDEHGVGARTCQQD